MLLARLCTKLAKPNGQYWVRGDDVQTFIGMSLLSTTTFAACVRIEEFMKTYKSEAIAKVCIKRLIVAFFFMIYLIVLIVLEKQNVCL